MKNGIFALRVKHKLKTLAVFFYLGNIVALSTPGFSGVFDTKPLNCASGYCVVLKEEFKSLPINTHFCFEQNSGGDYMVSHPKKTVKAEIPIDISKKTACKNNDRGGAPYGNLKPYGDPSKWKPCGACSLMHSRGGEWPGNDYIRPTGAPIIAPFDGSVFKGGKGIKDSWGNTYMYIRDSHKGDVEMLIMHSNFNISNGESFKKGDVLGTTASIGNSTAPHEHLSLKVNGRTEDPEKFFYN